MKTEREELVKLFHHVIKKYPPSRRFSGSSIVLKAYAELRKFDQQIDLGRLSIYYHTEHTPEQMADRELMLRPPTHDDTEEKTLIPYHGRMDREGAIRISKKGSGSHRDTRWDLYREVEQIILNPENYLKGYGIVNLAPSDFFERLRETHRKIQGDKLPNKKQLKKSLTQSNIERSILSLPKTDSGNLPQVVNRAVSVLQTLYGLWMLGNDPFLSVTLERVLLIESLFSGEKMFRLHTGQGKKITPEAALKKINVVRAYVYGGTGNHDTKFYRCESEFYRTFLFCMIDYAVFNEFLHEHLELHLRKKLAEMKPLMDSFPNDRLQAILQESYPWLFYQSTHI